MRMFALNTDIFIPLLRSGAMFKGSRATPASYSSPRSDLFLFESILREQMYSNMEYITLLLDENSVCWPYRICIK
jgi:hypothetical protein